MKETPGKYIKISKYMSMVLRHRPEEAALTLDEHGWANVDALIRAINKRRMAVNHRVLEEIVAADEKQRYSFNEDHTKIRANQGHSIAVDVELKETEPPAVLYHGTAERFYDSIMRQGLKKQNRNYVHLSADKETAVTVGTRHGKPVVLAVDAAKMRADGYTFYLSENKVWLTGHVPASYLKKMPAER